MDVFNLIIAITIIYCCGSVLLRLFDNYEIYTSRLERIAISFTLGLFAIVLIQLYMLFAKIPLKKGTILLFVLPIIGVKAYYYLRALFVFKKIKGMALKEPIWRMLPRLSLPEYFIIFYISILSLIVLFVCVAMPPYTWDARGVWLFYPKIFFYQKTIFTADFLDPYRYLRHHSYPLLIALGINFIYEMLGKVNDYTVKILFGLLYVCFIFILYEIQKKYLWLSRTHSLIFTAVFASLPAYFRIINGSVPSAYADFPLSFFYLLTIIHVIRYIIEPKTKILFIASIFASMCIFTKNEGIVLWFLSFIILLGEGLYAQLLRNKVFLKDLALYVFFPLFLLLPWFLIRSALPKIDDNIPLYSFTVRNIISRAVNIPIVIKYTFLSMVLDYYTWGVIWAIILLSIILYFTSRNYFFDNPRIFNYLLLIPIAHYLFVLIPIHAFYLPYATANFSLPIESEFKYTASTFDGGGSFVRLCMHTMPLLFLFVSLQINNVFKRKATSYL